MTIRSSFLRHACGWFIVLGMAIGVRTDAYALSRKKPVEPTVGPTPGFAWNGEERALSFLMREGRSGLDVFSGEERLRLLDGAKRYARLRRGKVSERERRAFEAECAQAGGRDPFCQLHAAGPEQNDGARSSRTRLRRKFSKAKLREILTSSLRIAGQKGR